MNESTDKTSVATTNVACNEPQPIDAVTEEWRPVVGYEGLYEVSSLGRVREAESRTILEHTHCKVRGKVSPYPAVRLFWRDSKGLRQSRATSIHNLVAAAFLVNSSGGYRIQHKDGNPENNAASNLEWPVSSIHVPKPIEGEIWLPIPDFPGYEASDYGQIRNKSSHQILKPHFGSSPYLLVILYRTEDNKSVPYVRLVHRLVAAAFLPRVAGKDYVDHINTIKTDNRACNLKWCTCTENHLNPLTYKRMSDSNKRVGKLPEQREKISKAKDPYKKPILCTTTGLLYPSLHEAHRRMWAKRASIKRSCTRAEQGLDASIRLDSIGGFPLAFAYYKGKPLADLRD